MTPLVTAAALRFEAEAPAPGTVPAGFARLEVTFEQGLPHRMALDAELSLIIALPNGSAAAWARAAVDAPVASSEFDLALVKDGEARLDGSLRLLLAQGRRLAAAAPLRTGARLRLPATGAALAELIVLSYGVTAGAMRGAAASGAFLAIAWRRLGPVDRLIEPAPPASVATRIAREESALPVHDAEGGGGFR